MSRGLAKPAEVKDGERLFVAGLLRDPGHPVMYKTVQECCRHAMLAAEQRSGSAVNLSGYVDFTSYDLPGR